MAIVEQFLASVQVGDSANKLASGSVRVSPADARAYIAAANQAARDATDVGLLLDSMIDITRAAGTNGYKKWSVEANFINDAFVYPDEDAGIYNSNKWKVTGSTTNNGLPAIDTFYIPQYLVTGIDMESDGISANLDDGGIVENLVTQVLATALSKFGTAFTSIISIQRNDS